MLGDSDAVPARPALIACIGLALLLGACSGAAAAQGDSLQDGADAFARKDYPNATRLLSPLARQGDPVAGCMVTIMQDEAHGRVAYDAAGMSATCIAAAHGMPAAELDLAGNYRTGLILGQDDAKAAALHRRAADHGQPVAQKVLGDLYAEGAGVKRDFATACRWWGRAAMQGQSAAQRRYGTCYLTGTGMARDEMQALVWWLIAKDNESEDRDGLPAWMFQNEAEADRATQALMQRLPADQVAEAEARARAWRPKPE
jgi:TPR repeat protein